MVAIDWGVTLDFLAGHDPVHRSWIMITPVCDVLLRSAYLNEYKDKKVNSCFLSNKDFNPCRI